MPVFVILSTFYIFIFIFLYKNLIRPKIYLFAEMLVYF